MPNISASPLEIIALAIFSIAVIHTFSTKIFARIAHAYPKHAGFWHLLAEVEVVFGFWAFVLVACIFWLKGKDAAVNYLETRNFTEPMFVFVIMVIAASKPILQSVMHAVEMLARMIPLNRSVAIYFLCLGIIPLLGSLVTEPAAMTLAALMLRDRFFNNTFPNTFKYATLGLLFVNISIGGTLTNFAAPPVLMVATTWQWDTLHMLTHFGWKAALAVFFNAAVYTWIFRSVLVTKSGNPGNSNKSTPQSVALVHMAFLLGVVIFAHHPVVFMGLFLFFLGYTEAYRQFQDRLILREGLLVAFFLAGLVVLGGLQQWWLQEMLTGVKPTTVYFIATALTAVTDNAAITYMASLVEGVSDEFKYAVVAGAVTGGGLTIIANAPNPAGFAILKTGFRDETVNPLGLFLAALGPTCVAAFAFMIL